jgi:hypothetical protein
LLIQKRYYIWDDKKFDFPIKLGMSKTELLQKGLVLEVYSNEKSEVEYSGVNELPWRIDFKDDFVDKMWFNQQNDFIYDNTDLKEEVINHGEPSIEIKFEKIPELTNKEVELKNYQNTDVLYIVLGDFFIRMIGILRKTNKKLQQS